MTVDPVDPGGGGGPMDTSAWPESWSGPEAAAVRALDRAHESVTSALGRLLAADDVEWIGGPAVAYRRQLDDAVDQVRAARLRLGDAVRAAEEHAAAVRCQGALTLGAPPSWPPDPGGAAWGAGAGRPGLVPGPRRP